MCFETVTQFYVAVYGLGLLTLPGLYAVWRFARWAAISTVKAIIDGLHRKLFPERRQQPQQPRHDHNQPRPQQQPQNPNKLHNGQGQNQGRPPQPFQQQHHQTQGHQPLNA